MKKKLWQFETPEVIHSAIGVIIYVILSWAMSSLHLPSSANLAIQPVVAIPMFFGVIFGPVVGFITGFLGYILADLLSGYSFSLWWSLGYGLQGAIPGLIWLSITGFRHVGNFIKVEILVLVGVIVGMGLAALIEKGVSGTSYSTTLAIYFLPAFTTNAIWGLILIPILLSVYSAIQSRFGR